MSRTIDERVVSMQFDNRHFEQNVQTSMSTIEKLKRSLNFGGAAKGFDTINASVKNVSMNPITKGIETVQAKFSALEVMGVTALANLTNSAVNAGKRIAKALTIEPVTTGLKEYETQINAVQTILANTSHAGTSLDDVNAALDELNKYADLTIYNFTEMTRNIGTFTAAGIDLDTSVNAIQGIANLAAVSGSTSQQASTAMYQLSQALAAGTIRLMDWNSVVNAGMGGKVFQDALRETSELLGTGAEKAIKATGSFRESLREEWLTAEVLTETLKKFTETGAVEYIVELTGLSAEAVEELQELGNTAGMDSKEFDELADSITNGNKALKEQVVEALKFAQTATDAATKVKTFSQLMDTLKESIQSGWTQTWEIIIGDFEEAKELWTSISDFLTGRNGIITKMSEARNNILEKVMTSGWKKLTNEINRTGIATSAFEESVRKIVGDSKVDKLIEDYGSLEKVFQQGKLSSDILKKALENLKNSTVDLSSVTRKLKFGDTGEDVKKVQEALVKLGHELPKFGIDGIIGPETTAAIKAFQELKGLKITGIVDDATLDALNEACTTTVEWKKNIDDLIAGVTERGGRDMLIESFKKIGEALGKIFGGITDAFKEMFDISSEDISDGIYNMIESLHEFSLGLDDIDGLVDKVNRIARGVFAFTKLFTSFSTKLAFVGFDVLRGVFGVTNVDLLEMAACLGDAIVKVKDMIFNSELLAVDLTKISGAIVGCIVKVAEWINSFIALPGVQRTISSLTDVIDGVTNAITGLLDGTLSFTGFFEEIGKTISTFANKVLDTYPALRGLVNLIKNFAISLGGGSMFSGILDDLRARVTDAYNAGKDIIDGIAQGLRDGTMTLGQAILEAARAIYETFCAFFGINSPSTLMIAAGGFIIAGLVAGLLAGKGDLIAGVKTIGKVIMDAFKSMTDAIPKYASKLLETVKKLDVGKIIAAVISASLLILFNKFLNVLEGFTNPLSKLGDLFGAAAKAVSGFGDVLKSVAFENKTKGIKNIAVSLAILLGAVAAITLVVSKYDVSLADMGKVVLIVIGLSAVLAALAWGMSKFADSAATFNKTSDKTSFSLKSIAPKLIALGAALLMMAGVIKLLSGIKANELEQGLISMAKIILSMVGILAAFKLLNGKDATGLNGAGKTMRNIAVALLLMVAVVKLAAGLDRGELERGTKFALAFAVFVGIIANVSKVSNDKAIYEMGGSMIKLAIAMGLMVGVVKLVKYLEADEMKKGAAFAAAFVVFIKSLVWATTIGNKQQLAKLGGLVLSVSFALLLMVGVCKVAGSLTTDELHKGVAFVAAFGLLIAGFVQAMKLSSKQKMAEASATITAFAIAIGAMAAVSILLGVIPTEYLVKGLVAVGLLSTMMAAMVRATKGANGKNVMKNLIVIAATIALLVGAVVGLSFIPTNDLIASVGGMVLLVAALSVLISSTSKMRYSKNMLKTLSMLSGVVLVLAGIVALLSQVPDPSGVLETTAALSLLLISFSAAMVILGKVGRISTTVGKNIWTVVGVAAVLTGLVAALANVPNPQNAILNTVALSILLNSFAASLVIMGRVGKISSTVTKNLVKFSAVAVLLAGIVAALAFIPNPQNAIANTVALSILLEAFAGAMWILGHAGKISSSVAKNLDNLAGIAVALAAIVAVLAYIPNPQNAIGNTIALSILLEAFAGAMWILGNVKSNVPPALSTLGALIGVTAALALILGAMSKLNVTASIPTAIALGVLLNAMASALLIMSWTGPMATKAVGPMYALTIVIAALAMILGAMSEMDVVPSIETATALSILLVGMSGALLLLSLAGPLAASAYASIGALGVLIGGLTIVLVALAGLNDLMGGKLEDLLNRGIPLLQKIGEGLGAFVGGIFAGFGEAVTSKLPTIAENLSSFVKTFVSGVVDSIKSVDETAVTGALNAAKVIAALAGAQLVDSIANILSWGSSMDTIGTKLTAFANAVVDFSNILVQGNINTDAIKAASDAGLMMAALSEAMPKSDGLWQDIIGESDMESFGKKMVSFGTCLVDFSKKVAEKDAINPEAINKARDAGLAMNELADAVPKTGGIWQEIAGVADIGTFGASMKAYGEMLVEFSRKISEEDALNPSAIESAKEAGLAMNELVSVIPKTDGMWQDIMGVEDLGIFGASIEAFGTSLVNFSNIVAPGGSLAINPMAVTAALIAGQLFAALNNALPQTKGVVQKFCEFFTGGTMTMEQFGNELANFGEAVGKFCEATVDINPVGLNLMSSAVYLLVQCIKAMEGITTDGVKDFSSAVNELADVDVAGFYDSFTADKADNAASAVKKILNLIKSMVGLDSSGIATFKDALSQLATVEISNFVSAFSSAATELAQAGTDMMAGLVNGITSGVPKLLSTVKMAIMNMHTSITSFTPRFMVSGVNILNNLAMGLRVSAPRAISAVRQAILTTLNAITSAYSSFYANGRYLGEGLVAGINSKKQAAYNAGYALGRAAVQGEKDGQESESPSKATIRAGKWLGEGLVIGIKKMNKAVYRAGHNVGETATDSISSAIARVADFLDSDMDTNPTIRPVLDLTDVTDGANRLNSLFATNQTVGLMANVGAVNTMMSRRNQNGVNDDVVYAIDKLRKDVNRLEMINYTIGGITYDDGSAMSEAVKQLVRAARVERRV